MDAVSTLTPKGLFYLPNEIRKKAGFKAKDRIRMRVEGNAVILQRSPTVSEMKGFLKTNKRFTLEEEEKLLEKELIKYYRKKFGVNQNL